MKNFFLACFMILGLASCGINKQAQQIKALEKCDYRLTDATNITIAGTDVRKLMEGKSVNTMSIPGIALGLLRKDIPLRAKLNLEISNPSNALAAINNFDYIVLINKQEIFSGSVDQSVTIGAGQTTQVPVQVNANIYQFLTDSKMLDDIGAFISGATNGNEKKGLVTLKIRPSIKVAGGLIKYPGYITIDKEVSSKILL
ncbi:LEA type 2 family protein [Pedobacter sp. ASV28]|uniref:LEA type 2 family protein n=1 Tax=Pedobacter sp. ASV28 TaxID=2795123 RepID=UPI0018EE11DE|nr:LEA type 2 family protein [Pedobacter sp. ASV28]